LRPSVWRQRRRRHSFFLLLFVFLLVFVLLHVVIYRRGSGFHDGRCLPTVRQ
jgi:hypothetical protein